MLRFIIFCLFFYICCTFGHSGRTDSNGGHWNHSTGTYHYHSYRTLNNLSSMPNENKFNLFSVLDNNFEKKQFSNFTEADQNDGVSFKIESSENINVKFDYIFDNKLINSLTLSIKEGLGNFVPSEDKSIILDKKGIHKFKFSNSDYIQEVTVVINEKDIEFSKAKAPFFAKKKEIFIPSAYKNLKADYENFSEIKISQDENTRASGSEIYKKMSSSVVLISTDSGYGSGSLISPEGEILTNYHVIEGNDKVKVNFKPAKFSKVCSSDAFIADVVKFNETKDLALIKLRSPIPNFNVIPLGSINDIEIAEEVHAIGHPLGFNWTYTKGVISQITPDFEWGSEKINKADVIQTQTPINPGNSGGPLFNEDMRLIGINSFTRNNAQGLNFAVAITSVKEFLEQSEKEIKSKEIKSDSSSIIGKLYEEDIDGDGATEHIIIGDNDENGIPDQLIIDWNKDGTRDTIFGDTDENGKRDLVIEFYYPPEVDFPVATVKYDYDQDGEWDYIKYDRGIDGIFEKEHAL